MLFRPCCRDAGRRRLAGVAVEPAAHVVRVHLLAPDEAGAGLAEDLHLVGGRAFGRDRRVELVRVGLARGDDLVERVARPGRLGGGLRLPRRLMEAQAQLGRAAGGHGHAVAERRLRADAVRVDGVGARHDVVVDPVLRVRRRRLRPEDPRRVRLVLAEERLGLRAVRGRGRPRAGSRRARGPRRRPPSRRLRASDASPRRPTTRCCGTTASAARRSSPRPGPWFSSSIRISTSVGEAFAYVTSTDQKRSSSNAPVSSSSSSGSFSPRPWWTSCS